MQMLAPTLNPLLGLAVYLFSAKCEWYSAFKWDVLMKMLISHTMLDSDIWSWARRIFLLRAQVARELFLLSSTPVNTGKSEIRYTMI